MIHGHELVFLRLVFLYIQPRIAQHDTLGALT
jgi:hypothetical protein